MCASRRQLSHFITWLGAYAASILIGDKLFPAIADAYWQTKGPSEFMGRMLVVGNFNYKINVMKLSGAP